MSEATPLPTECHTCGEPIGDNQFKNVIFMCDKPRNDNKAWCAKCFKNKPCGLGMHGEGCPTLVACEPMSESFHGI